jgi:hypothetical protein
MMVSKRNLTKNIAARHTNATARSTFFSVGVIRVFIPRFYKTAGMGQSCFVKGIITDTPHIRQIFLAAILVGRGGSGLHSQLRWQARRSDALPRSSYSGSHRDGRGFCRRLDACPCVRRSLPDNGRSLLIGLNGPTSGVRHSVDVTAESVYEAAALGLSLLRRDEWADQIAPGTPIEIAVREPATTHTVSLAQIHRWCDGVAVSPEELQKRKRVRELIGSLP